MAAGGKGDDGLGSGADGFERVCRDQRKIDDAGASGEVVGFSGKGFPSLVDVGVVGSIGEIADGTGASVHLDEEATCGTGIETE